MKLLYYPWLFLFISIINAILTINSERFLGAAAFTSTYYVYFAGFQLYSIFLFSDRGTGYVATGLFGVLIVSLLVSLTGHPLLNGYQVPEALISAAGVIFLVSFFGLMVMGAAALNQGLVQQGARSGVLKVLILNFFLIFSIFFFWGPLFKRRDASSAPTGI